MTRTYTRKNTASPSKLAEEFEEHYNKSAQADPDVDPRVVFENWASQKITSLQLGVFKMYTQLDE